MLGDVSFIKAASSLGTPANGEDFISGIVFYTDTAPAGFATQNKQLVFSVEQAEALGLVGDYSDETTGQGTIQITAAGSNGDTITATFLDIDGNVITLGKYIVQTSDGVNDIATGLNIAINLRTPTTGFSSTTSTDTVTVIFKKGLGVYPNTGTPLATTLVGTVTNTITQATVTGVPSILAPFHYHVSEFFRANPTGDLWIGIFDVPGTFDGTEVSTLQNFAAGKIKQCGVYYPDEAGTTGMLTALQVVYNALYDAHMPLEIYFAGDNSSTTVSALDDLSLLDAENVHCIIAQDGAALGFRLSIASDYSISTLGNALGDTSAAKVSVNIGWRALFPNSNGTELETIAFTTGELYSDISATQLNVLDNYHYMFLVKNVGITGSFYNDTWSAVSATSDYNKAERNRTIDKAIRNIRSVLLPSLNSPLYVNADGTLTNPTISFFKATAEAPLADMQSNGEIGAPPNPAGGGLPAAGYQIVIDASQNVITTNKIVLTVKMIPVGLAKFIEVNIGFTVKIA